MARKTKKKKLHEYVVAHSVTITRKRWVRAYSSQKALKEAEELEGRHGEEFDYDESEGMETHLWTHKLKPNQ